MFWLSLIKSLTVMQTQKLSSLQLELLKVYSFQPSDEDLLAVRKLLATFFSDKLIGKVSQAVDEQGITEADLDSWLNE
ncbi:MAG TPA: hypothetical protein VGB67_06585 [Fibrella sp.]